MPLGGSADLGYSPRLEADRMPGSPNPTLHGAALIVAGMVVIGCIDNLVRVIAGEVGLWQFHLMRSAMALPLLVLAAVAGLRLVPLRPGRVAVRSGVQAASMLLYFGALPFMPIAQVGAGLFTAPLFVLLFSAALFGHRIGPRRLCAVAIGFTGVLIMLRPDPANLSPLLLMPVAAGALYAMSNLLTREWCADEPVGVLLGSFFLAIGLAGAAGCALLALFPASREIQAAAPFLARPMAIPSATVLFWIAAQAVGSLVAVGLITRGYQSAETSYLTVFDYSFLISASTWAWVIWGDTLDPASLLGVAMILTSGAIIATAARPAAGPAPG
jgi:drug/metabolite transporter (DMT)-like permease